MTADEKPADASVEAKGLFAVSKREARLVALSVRATALDPMHGSSLGARFGYGFGLPFALARRVLADESARRFYLRVKLRQLAAVLVTTLVIAGLVASSEGFDGDHGALHIRSKGGLAALLSSLYAVLAGVEWCVIAVSRQFDDQIARAASLISATPPEDPDLRPEVHIDVPWMWRKGKRRLRGMRVFASGLPLLSVALAIPHVGVFINGVLTFLWGSYWAMVFTAAKSSTAWRDEGKARDPWFLRWLVHLTEKVPGFRWWGPRLYLRTWRRLTVALASPCQCVERRPLEILGLATLRAVVGLPGAYLFLRPLIMVAAARINRAGYAAEDAPPEAVSALPDTPSPAG